MDESPRPVAGNLPVSAGFPQLRTMKCHVCDVTWKGSDEPCWNCGVSGLPAYATVVPGAATFTVPVA